MSFYKNKDILVSIIMPVYNRRALLPRAINSVVVQTIDNWELVIIDDGSTDGTGDFVKSLIKTEKRISYYKFEHRGISPSLNAGIEKSKGKYITFLGSDDEYLPEHLELHVKLIQENTNVDLIYGGVKIIGDPYVPDKRDLGKKIHIDNCIVGGTFFGKREVFVELNGFRNIPYSEDSEFFERAIKLFKVLKCEERTYVYHRDTDDSICNSVENRQK